MPHSIKNRPTYNTFQVKYYLSIFILLLILSCKKQAKTIEQVEQTRDDQRPNIVLIVADDQGWGDLSSSGNSNLNTPNIDAIAKYGITFENFYVQPVCSPTRAELLTGRYYSRSGVYSTSAGGERMNASETTLAEILKTAGYTNAIYGKWHNGTQPPYHPNSQGFDDFYGFASGHWGNYFNPVLEHNGEIVKGKGFLVDDLTDHAIEFIEQEKNSPFFLYLPYNTPHSPMQVPDRNWNNFKNKEIQLLAEPGTGEDIQFTKAALAMVENIDENVGRVMAKLRELYLDDNTIIVYLSDNGPNSFRWNNGMRGRKGSTDEGGVRSPLYIQWPKTLKAGQNIHQIAGAIDLLPTLVNLADVDIDVTVEKTLDGTDLTPLLFEETNIWKERVLFNHWNGKTSLRTQEYRLDTDNRLYHILKDRGQKKDLSTQLKSLTDSLVKIKKNWVQKVVTENNPKNDNRPFTLGHADYDFTHLPARDGEASGAIQRSNKYPNDSYYTHWVSIKDSITWNVEVLEDGEFEVELYYTCPKENLGAILELSFQNSSIAKKITEAHNPPLQGKDHDRIPRMESYVKEFKPLPLGTMILRKGKGNLSLKALEISGKEVADIRLLTFRRID